MDNEIVNNIIKWSPSVERVESSQMYKFMKFINSNYNLDIHNFYDLHSWSIKYKSEFWESVWDFFDVIGTKGKSPYINPMNMMPGSKFFPNGSVNYAENMLSGNLNGPAIIFRSECNVRKEISWNELKTQVASTVKFF